MRVLVCAAAVVVTGMVALGCGSSSGDGGSQGLAGGLAPTPSNDPWPLGYGLVFTKSGVDAVNDLTVAHPGDGPAELVPFPSVDSSRVQMGIEGDYLYIRLDYAGVIPTRPVNIPASVGIEAQVVDAQAQSFVLNVDADDLTGAGAAPWLEGVDLFFGVVFKYGVETLVYANWDFLGGDIHLNQSQLIGEVGEGGQGFDYVVVRYDVSLLPAAFFPRGQTVGIGSWTEAESNLYHEMALDSVLEHDTWAIPN